MGGGGLSYVRSFFFFFFQTFYVLARFFQLGRGTNVPTAVLKKSLTTSCSWSSPPQKLGYISTNNHSFEYSLQTLWSARAVSNSLRPVCCDRRSPFHRARLSLLPSIDLRAISVLSVLALIG